MPSTWTPAEPASREHYVANPIARHELAGMTKAFAPDPPRNALLAESRAAEVARKMRRETYASA
jgi:hypothetical protein